jgi:hypothetical protein
MSELSTTEQQNIQFAMAELGRFLELGPNLAEQAEVAELVIEQNRLRRRGARIWTPDACTKLALCTLRLAERKQKERMANM